MTVSPEAPGGETEPAPANHPQPVRVPLIEQVASAALKPHVEAGEFFWLHLEDPAETAIDELASLLDLHPLAVRAAKAFGQRPKLEIFDSFAYLVFYGAHPRGEDDDPLHEVHLFLAAGYVVSIHRGVDDALTELRAAVTERPVRSPQFLIYEILASLADTFFPVLSALDDELDVLEDVILSRPTAAQLQRINAIKRELTSLRRVITPQRDIFARNIEELEALEGMQGHHPEYFRVVYDDLIRVSDMVDSFRDLTSGATDLYLSTVANRQGEVGKQLAIIATVFLPLSFLTGFFGQNFSLLTGHVINHDWTFWPLGIGSLIVSILIMIWFFRRKGWMGDPAAPELAPRPRSGTAGRGAPSSGD